MVTTPIGRLAEDAKSPSPDPAAPPARPVDRQAELPLYQEIADNARLATGARFVHLSWFDPDSLTVHVGATSSVTTRFLMPGMEVIRRAFPGWDPAQVRFRADVNPSTAAVFLHRKSIHVPLSDVVAGTVHPQIARVAGSIVGMRWCFSCPVEVQGQVAASLALHGPEPFTELQRQACVAFARQAALTLENARLLGAVREHEVELRRSRQLLAAAEDRQRRDIALLLGSRVQNQLLVVWHELGQASRSCPDAPPELLAMVAKARDEIARIGEQEMGRASLLLHPALLLVALEPAIRALADHVGGAPPITVESTPAFAPLDAPGENHIPATVRLAAYRVVEEALANALRHAHAGRIRVLLDAPAAGWLRLTVEDDGRGFDPQSDHQGLGLQVIGSRIEQAGGQWGVTSAPGQGTSLWCLLPLDGAAPG